MRLHPLRASQVKPPAVLQISERTRAGALAAQGRGVKFGRKPKLTPQQKAHAQKLIEDGQRREDIANLFKVNSIYK